MRQQNTAKTEHTKETNNVKLPGGKSIQFVWLTRSSGSEIGPYCLELSDHEYTLTLIDQYKQRQNYAFIDLQNTTRFR